MGMSIETRTTIELSDVIAVEIQCVNCGAQFSCTLDRLKVGFDECRNCKTAWGTTELDNDIKRIEQFLPQLRLVCGLLAKGIFPFKLRFEITQPSHKEGL
jgi:ribosomal protein L37AE/L43A